jgi:hypothetical protein
MRYCVHHVVPHGEPHLHGEPAPSQQTAPASAAGRTQLSIASPSLASAALIFTSSWVSIGIAISMNWHPWRDGDAERTQCAHVPRAVPRHQPVLPGTAGTDATDPPLTCPMMPISGCYVAQPNEEGDTAMIGVLTAVVVVVGVVATADLLLSFAVIRRVALLQSRPDHVTGGNSAPAIGHQVGDFSVQMMNGGHFTRADLSGGDAVVAFLMSGCDPCEATAAELRQMPLALPVPLYVLIVGTQLDDDVFEITMGMPDGARVGVVPAGDPVTSAFGLDGFPTVIALHDGVVRAVELRVSGVLDYAGR